MAFPLILAFAQGLFGILLVLMAIFLILLVLVQRGRGGGLAGALGGMGGSSAFGAKAGDVFTRITIVAAALWILLCIAASRWGASTASRIDIQGGSGSSSAAGALDPGDDEEVAAPADGEAAAGATGAAQTGTPPTDEASAAPADATDAATGDAASDE